MSDTPPATPPAVDLKAARFFAKQALTALESEIELGDRLYEIEKYLRSLNAVLSNK
jgi:hypothetical protein